MAEVYYKALKKWADRSYVKVITALVGAAILYMSITQGNIIYGCFGVLLVIVAFYNTDVVADKNGLHTYTKVFFHKHSYSYLYKDMVGLSAELPQLRGMKIHFVRPNSIIKLKFDAQEGEKVVEMAMKANPGMEIRRVRPRRRNIL